MTNATTKETQNPPRVVGARVGDLAPLVAKWMQRNPGVPTSKLVQRGLRMALKEIAGKRYSHLVEV